MSELRNKILITASSLMDKYGISSVTMDDIAKECHISKRTLYEKIPDKRTLVWNCILHNREKTQSEAMVLAKESTSILDALLQIYRHMRKNLTEASSIFFKDMNRLYPELGKQCREMHRQQAQSLGKFLQKGIQEGMFSSNIDLSLAAEVFIAQSSIIMKEMGASNDIDTVGKMIDTAFIIFLRGVATQKGIEIIDDFFKENNI